MEIEKIIIDILWKDEGVDDTEATFCTWKQAHWFLLETWILFHEYMMKGSMFF